MTTQLSNGTDTLTPEVVHGYRSTRRSRTVVHAIIGTNEPAVTLRPAALRSGQLVFITGTDETISKQFEEMLSGDDVLTLTDTDRATVEMSFVVTDDIERELDEETQEVWIVTCGFQEVAT